ncbi:MAG: lactate racemase domain-containing protein [Desulfobacterales bacterium]
MNLPPMCRIRQHFDKTRVTDLPTSVLAELNQLPWDKLQPGDRVAIAAGSRGIANFADIILAIVDFLKSLDTRPFLIPAMGSHGGATAEGQVAVLAELGVTEAVVQAPILASMDVEQIGLTEDGVPVFLDKYALEADHIVVVNRIKSHTKFKASIESGLLKMMSVGMGKHTGAAYYHKAAIQYTFAKVIRDAARIVLRRAPILCAVGIVENGYGQTARIAALRPDAIETGEEKLLILSKKMMAQLPFNEIDLLIIDEMGKNISGVGFDPNVTGRNRDLMGAFSHPARIKRIFVRDLTDQSKGNAIGIGLADITTQRLVDKIDYAVTYKNCITGTSLEKGAVPMHFSSDRQAIEVALESIGLIPAAMSKIVRIQNTLQLEFLEASEACIQELRPGNDVEIIKGPELMEFDSHNNLLAL